MESRSGFKEGEPSIGEDSPSNSSSLEESLSDNREDNDFTNDSSSNNDLEKPVPERGYDEQQLSEMQAVLPFLKGEKHWSITQLL